MEIRSYITHESWASSCRKMLHVAIFVLITSKVAFGSVVNRIIQPADHCPPLVGCVGNTLTNDVHCIFNTKRSQSYAALLQSRWVLRSNDSEKYVYNKPLVAERYSETLVVVFQGEFYSLCSVALLNAKDEETCNYGKDMRVEYHADNAKKYDVVAYTSVSINFWKDDSTNISKQVQAIHKWSQYHKRIGVDQIYVYLDFGLPRTQLHTDFENALKNLNDVVVRTFFSKDIVPLHNQHGLLTHAFYKLKYNSIWFAFMDVDEYFQPLQSLNLSAILHQRDKDDSISTFQVKSAFWFHKTSPSWTTNIRGMIWKYAIEENGRQKCFFNTQRVMYPTIHEPSVPTTNIHILNPDTELRLNHFKYFGQFRKPSESDTIDTSFYHLLSSVRTTNKAQWMVP